MSIVIFVLTEAESLVLSMASRQDAVHLTSNNPLKRDYRVLPRHGALFEKT
jgi:hypothetical protein